MRFGQGVDASAWPSIGSAARVSSRSPRWAVCRLVKIDCEFAALGVPRRWIETLAATRVCTDGSSTAGTMSGTVSGTVYPRVVVGGRITELVENGRPLEASVS